MSEAARTTHVNGQGVVKLKQAPSILLMKQHVYATEATLELGLANVKKKCASAVRWLQGLGAMQVDFGEPFFGNAASASSDPMKHMREMAARMGQMTGAPAPDTRKRELHIILTALWDITGKSAEERLVFLDRLQFEASSDTSSEEPENERSIGAPEEQIQAMLVAMTKPTQNDYQPQFLFISKLDDARHLAASKEAVTIAFRQAGRLADGLGATSSKLASVHYNQHYSDAVRTDRMMEQQRCSAILSGTSYVLGENEQASEDPRSAEFTVCVGAMFLVDLP
jgi:hypothetical protein